MTLMAGPDRYPRQPDRGQPAGDQPADRLVRAQPDRHRAVALQWRLAPRLPGFHPARRLHEHEPRPARQGPARPVLPYRQWRSATRRRRSANSTTNTLRSWICPPNSTCRRCSACSRSTPCRWASCTGAAGGSIRAAIRRTALFTVEGERDDICAVGQTLAAQELCSSLRPYMKRHHVQPGVGHYGVFNGQRWNSLIYPMLRNVVYASD